MKSNDGDSAGDTAAQKVKKNEIFLPGPGYIMQIWKVKEGAVVQVGETIALAVPHESSSPSTTVSSSSAPTNPSPSMVAPSSSHKRPNRRRRPIGTKQATSDATTAALDTANSQSRNPGSTLATLQQRLAEKLAPDNKPPVLEPSTESGKSETSAPPPRPQEKQSPTVVPIRAPSTGLLRIYSDPEKTQVGEDCRIAVGNIEDCRHPTFLEGLCVVCGTSINQIQRNGIDGDKNDHSAIIFPSSSIPDGTTENSSLDHNYKMSQVTVSGGVTMTVSEQESRQIAERDRERLFQQVKLALVLDLDHTLVHATADPRAQQFLDKDDVRVLRLPVLEGVSTTNASVNNPFTHLMPDSSGPQTPLQQQQQHPTMPYMQHYVKLRPHIKTFLESVQKDYELTVYTAGTRQYAEEITIVLCRHMVGSNYDIDDLERLRYEVHRAEMEYQKIQALDQNNGNTEEMQKTEANGRAESDIDNHHDSSERNTKEQDGEEGNSKPKKRARVAFRSPEEDEDTDNGQESSIDEGKKVLNNKSDHVTRKQVETLRKKLADVEEQEKKAWDLRQKIFGSRVVSRTDVGDLGRDVKSLKRIFPCGGTMAAVVDDREDVWANARDNSTNTIKGEPPANLLLVRPYHWQPFIGFADVNNAAGSDLSGENPGSSDGEDPNIEKDVQLIWTSRILKGLHRRYYRQDMDNRKSVPELLEQMRSQVLKGTTLVLSGLVPLHKKTISSASPRPSIVRYAQSLGAQVRSTRILLHGDSMVRESVRYSQQRYYSF